MSDINDRIRQFIVDEIMFEEPSSNIADDTPLLQGIVDSLGLMQLVSYIEETFDVTIDDSEVTVDNFATIDDIAKLVGVKAGAD